MAKDTRDLTPMMIAQCHMDAISRQNGNDLAQAYGSEILYMDLLEDGKTSQKLASGLIDGPALDSYAFKYAAAVKALSPFAEKGFIDAMEFVYRIYNGNPFNGPLAYYQKDPEFRQTPNISSFDNLLDDAKAFLWLKRLFQRDRKEYIYRYADALNKGHGINQAKPSQGIPLLFEATFQYDDVSAANSLSMWILVTVTGSLATAPTAKKRNAVASSAATAFPRNGV